MKFHDYSECLGLALVTDDENHEWRYEDMVVRPELEDTPLYLLRQGHYVANAIANGLVIVGSRIKLIPSEWQRLGPEVAFKRSIGAMT